MKPRLFAVLLGLAVTAVAMADDKVTLTTSPPLVKNVYDIPGVQRAIPGSPATYNEDAMSANVAAINGWLTDTQASTSGAKKNVLFVPYGYVAINGTLGASTDVSVVGYNNGETVHALPNGFAIICGGGWAIQDHGAQHSWNLGTAGFIWGGPDDEPMIRLSRNGNIVRANLYGYMFLTGATKPTDETPAKARCRAGIELWQQSGATQVGHSEIEVCIAGCEKAIWCFGGPGGNSHCDHLRVGRLTTRDCIYTFYSDQHQATNHHFDMVEHYCPLEAQSYVFYYDLGGGMTCDHVSITGDWGCHLLTTGNASTNLGNYEINGIQVDRSFFNATRAGNGSFRLHNHTDDTPFAVHLRGRMSHGSLPVSMLTPWYNLDSSPAITHATAISGAQRVMTVNVFGLDDETHAIYHDYNERAD
jgi:hypothetical protein